MVIVFMGHEDRMDVIQAGPKHLGPEIRPDIDGQANPSCLDKSCGTGALVPWIRGGANGTSTTDHRDALGSAGT